MPGEYLVISYSDEYKNDFEKDGGKFRNLPFAESEVLYGTILDNVLLTKGEDVRKTYKISLDLKETNFTFEPGSCIGILPSNEEKEVETLLKSLDVMDRSNLLYKLEILSETKKKNPTIPKHIPNTSTLKKIFQDYIDIRSTPKKLFLKSLIPYTTDQNEKELLSNLSSPKSSNYINFISQEGRTLTKLFETFKSCKPPIELIIEHSTPLQPRFYSISSSPKVLPKLTITFFIVENEDGSQGICTGYLERSLERSNEIPLYFRKANSFVLKENVPIVMIATGTGIAPFHSFLQHRNYLKDSGHDLKEALLFYGCRYKDRDFLYEQEIKHYLNEGVLNDFFIAPSRNTEKKIYIQDVIKEQRDIFRDYVMNKNATIYICGDAKTMVRDVLTAIESVLNQECKEEEDLFKKIKDNNRILIDSWI